MNAIVSFFYFILIYVVPKAESLKSDVILAQVLLNQSFILIILEENSNCKSFIYVYGLLFPLPITVFDKDCGCH